MQNSSPDQIYLDSINFSIQEAFKEDNAIGLQSLLSKNPVTGEKIQFSSYYAAYLLKLTVWNHNISPNCISWLVQNVDLSVIKEKWSAFNKFILNHITLNEYQKSQHLCLLPSIMSALKLDMKEMQIDFYMLTQEKLLKICFEHGVSPTQKMRLDIQGVENPTLETYVQALIYTSKEPHVYLPALALIKHYTTILQERQSLEQAITSDIEATKSHTHKL